MSFYKIDDFSHVSEAQDEYQQISFVLRELGVSINPEILSKATKNLIKSSILVGETGAYSFLKGKQDELYRAIHHDNLQDEFKHASSYTHARDLMTQMGI